MSEDQPDPARKLDLWMVVWTSKNEEHYQLVGVEGHSQIQDVERLISNYFQRLNYEGWHPELDERNIHTIQRIEGIDHGDAVCFGNVLVTR